MPHGCHDSWGRQKRPETAETPIPHNPWPELLRIRNADTERQLQALASSADADEDVEEATAAQTVRPFTLLLGAVVDGQPIDRHTVPGLIAADVQLLRQLGAFERDRRVGWPGTVTPDGMNFYTVSSS